MVPVRVALDILGEKRSRLLTPFAMCVHVISFIVIAVR